MWSRTLFFFNTSVGCARLVLTYYLCICCYVNTYAAVMMIMMMIVFRAATAALGFMRERGIIE